MAPIIELLPRGGSLFVGGGGLICPSMRTLKSGAELLRCMSTGIPAACKSCFAAVLCKKDSGHWGAKEEMSYGILGERG